MKKRVFAALLIIILMLCISACTNVSEKAVHASESLAAVSFEDALGRSVTVSNPKRVAVMIGSFADVWCLAGGRDTIVATASDAWKSFDLDLDESVINLGGVKDPNMEALIASDPDFIIASSNTTANLEMREALEDMGYNLAFFDIQNFSDYLNMLKICTEITDCPENYEKYGTALVAQVEKARAMSSTESPRVLMLRVAGSYCMAKGSKGTVLGEMLDDLGCINIADSDNSILENLSMEEIIKQDPDYILAVLHGTNLDDAQAMLDETLLSNPAWNTLSAVKNNHFFIMDYYLYNLKPNARWGEAYEKLAELLYGGN